MNFFIPPLLLENAADAGGETTNSLTSMLSLFGPIVIMVVIFFLLFMRPEQKRQKKHKSMLDNLQVADEVVTIGGIVGRVLSIKDDTVLVETGGDKTRIRVLRSSISENRTVHANDEIVTKK